MQQITNQELIDWIIEQEICVLFFKSTDCGVCQAQLPRVQAIAKNMEVAFKSINLTENPHLSGEQMVLSVPVTKVFYQGKELFKEGGYMDFERFSRLLTNLKAFN